MSNICPPESSDRDVSAQKIGRGENRQNGEEILLSINYIQAVGIDKLNMSLPITFLEIFLSK